MRYVRRREFLVNSTGLVATAAFCPVSVIFPRQVQAAVPEAIAFVQAGYAIYRSSQKKHPKSNPIIPMLIEINNSLNASHFRMTRIEESLAELLTSIQLIPAAVEKLIKSNNGVVASDKAAALCDTFVDEVQRTKPNDSTMRELLKDIDTARNVLFRQSDLHGLSMFAVAHFELGAMKLLNYSRNDAQITADRYLQRIREMSDKGNPDSIVAMANATISHRRKLETQLKQMLNITNNKLVSGDYGVYFASLVKQTNRFDYANSKRYGLCHWIAFDNSYTFTDGTGLSGSSAAAQLCKPPIKRYTHHFSELIADIEVRRSSLPFKNDAGQSYQLTNIQLIKTQENIISNKPFKDGRQPYHLQLNKTWPPLRDGQLTRPNAMNLKAHRSQSELNNEIRSANEDLNAVISEYNITHQAYASMVAIARTAKQTYTHVRNRMKDW